jgi:hypothetical protein
MTKKMCSPGTYIRMVYTVHSLYLALINNGTTHINKQLWRVKVPLKIKNFMWYMKKEVVLT